MPNPQRKFFSRIFTTHEEEEAFAVELVVRNLPPVDAFVVQWDYPRFERKEGLDPSRLKQGGGCPAKHKAETLLEVLGTKRLKTGEWSKLASSEYGVSNGSFFALLQQLQEAGRVVKSKIDGKWEPLQNFSKTSYHKKDQ